jgi:hypothetical protein
VIDWLIDKTLGVMILLLTLVALALPFVIWRIAKAEAKACAEIMAMARTNQDSITISLRCRLGSERRHTVTPVVVPVHVR